MQHALSHSRTQRGAQYPALSRRRRRRRPNPSTPASQSARRRCVLGARPSAPQTACPTPPRPRPPSGPWPPCVETGGERWNRVSERGEGGPLSFPLRPSNNQSRDPCARPRSAPPTSGCERTLAELLPCKAAPRRFGKFLAKNFLF